jgi:hypothetical protein
MDNYHTPAAIFGRFKRALLTHEQEPAEQFFVKASELIPEVQAAFEDDPLMEFEIFLLAAWLANTREIREMFRIMDKLETKLE